MLQHSTSNNTDASFTAAAPLQLTLLASTGTRATLVLDKVFQNTYNIPVRDAESLTVAALKKVIYKEWVAAVANNSKISNAPNVSDRSNDSKDMSEIKEDVVTGVHGPATITDLSSNDDAKTTSVSESVAPIPDTVSNNNDLQNNHNISTTTSATASHKPLEILDVPIESTGSLADLISDYPGLKDGEEEEEEVEAEKHTELPDSSYPDTLSTNLGTAELKNGFQQTQIPYENATKTVGHNVKTENVDETIKDYDTGTTANKPKLDATENLVSTPKPAGGSLHYTTEWANVLAKNVSPPPTSPDHIRLIHFGRVLDDNNTMASCGFIASTSLSGTTDSGSNNTNTQASAPNSNIPTSASNNPQQSTYVVHMSVRPALANSTSKRWGKSSKKNKNQSTDSSVNNNRSNNNNAGNTRNDFVNSETTSVPGTANSNRTNQDNGATNQHSTPGYDEDTSSGRCCIIC